MRHIFIRVFSPIALLTLFPAAVIATPGAVQKLDLTQANVGIAALAVFVLAYFFVMSEEFTHLRKSKPSFWLPASSGA